MCVLYILLRHTIALSGYVSCIVQRGVRVPRQPSLYDTTYVYMWRILQGEENARRGRETPQQFFAQEGEAETGRKR